MTSFDDIQDCWNQQPGSETPQPASEALIVLAQKNGREIRQKHIWTMSILAFSGLFIVWYTSRYAGVGFNRFHAGLSLMQFSLFFRLLAEYISLIYFSRIDIRSDLATYTKNITAYYRYRRIIHYLVTPVMIAAYITGFILLLPTFKQSFSASFYFYIVLSGCAFFIVFSWLLVRQIKKEMQLLNFLQQLK